MTRQQILASGVPRSRLRAALGQQWRMLLPGVILLDSGLPNLGQRLMAAQLLGGPHSWLAGPTAAAVHGLPHVPDIEQLGRVEVLVPAPCRPRTISWVHIRRTHLLDERLLERGPLRISSRARALVDAAAGLPSDSDVRATIIASVQQRLVRPHDVAHWIEARRPNGRALLRAALDEAMARVWSVPEGDVVETDADLVAARVVVLPVTPGSISRDPSRVLARVEKTYLSARESGHRAPVLATARDGWRTAS